MRTTPRSIFAWSSVLSLSCLISSVMVVVVDAERKCSLCESVQDVPKRLDYILEVSPSVVRCADAWINMGLLDINDSKCTILQNEYREKCCGEDEPTPMYSPPTSSPPDNGDSSVGTEPFCRICGDDKYPGSPDTHIVARYVGSATCGQLYHRGRQGTIPGFMCGPLQDFAYGVCQCANGSTLPNNNGGGGPAPTTPAPTPDPTPAPTPDPTPPPVSPPTTTTRAPSPTFEMVPTAIGARKVNNNGGSKEDQKIAGARYSRFNTNNYGNRRALDSRIDPSAKEEPTEVV